MELRDKVAPFLLCYYLMGNEDFDESILYNYSSTDCIYEMLKLLNHAGLITEDNLRTVIQSDWLLGSINQQLSNIDGRYFNEYDFKTLIAICQYVASNWPDGFQALSDYAMDILPRIVREQKQDKQSLLRNSIVLHM